MAVTINLTLDSITSKEAKALIAMLDVLEGIEIKKEGSDLRITPLTAGDFAHLIELSAPGRVDEVAVPAEEVAPEPVDPSGRLTPSPALAAPFQTAEVASVASPSPEPKKRTRKPKDGAAAHVDPTTGSPAAPSADASPTGPPAGASLEGEIVPTHDTLRDAVQHLIDKKGLPAAKELLKEFSCSRVAEMVENAVEQQLDFIRRCNA